MLYGMVLGGFGRTRKAAAGGSLTELFSDTLLQSSGGFQDIATYNAAYAVMVGGMRLANTIAGVEGTGSTYNVSRITGVTFNADQYSQVKLNISGGVYHGPAVRCQSGADTAYHVSTAGSDFYVEKRSAGSVSTVAGPVSQTFATGDILRLTVEGVGGTVTLKVYRALAASPTSFSQVGSNYTDSSSPITTAGTAGIEVYGTTAGTSLNTGWSAGNL
jgi:hypothetical protein